MNDLDLILKETNRFAKKDLIIEDFCVDDGFFDLTDPFTKFLHDEVKDFNYNDWRFFSFYDGFLEFGKEVSVQELIPYLIEFKEIGFLLPDKPADLDFKTKYVKKPSEYSAPTHLGVNLHFFEYDDDMYLITFRCLPTTRNCQQYLIKLA